MKDITNIIKQLKKKKPIEPNVMPVLAYIIEEAMEIDRADPNTVTVKMSQKMADRFFTFAYDQNGEYKFKD